MIKLNRNLLELIAAISVILDIEEDEMRYHGWRVAFLAQHLAKQCDPSNENELFLAGLIHDFGSFDISCRKLHQNLDYKKIEDPGILSHAMRGAKVLASFPPLRSMARLVMEHHERFDGQGYPLHLQGAQISRSAQLLRVADSLAERFQAHHIVTRQEVLDYLRSESGREFDSALLPGLRRAFEDASVFETANKIHILHQYVGKYNQRLYALNGDAEAEYEIERVLDFFGHFLDAKNAYTVGHSMRVADYSVMIGLAMGFSEKELETVRVAGILHDIGKIGIPTHILEKPGPLTKEEWAIVERHPTLGVQMIRSVAVLEHLVPILEADQEHFDGTGYPFQLKGEQIPLIARIIFVADAFDAMTTDRPYRKALPLKIALSELKEYGGRHFDPRVVDLACKLFGTIQLP